MRKFFSKIKSCLAAFRTALISFPFKVKGQGNWEWVDPQPDYWIITRTEPIIWQQWLYWVPSFSSHLEQTTTIVDTIIKIAPRLLIALTFIIWIVSFIKIKKIEDKTLRKRKIKKTTIIIAILIVLIVCLLLLPQVLNKSVSNALF